MTLHPNTELLSAYCDRALAPAEATGVREHIHICADCRRLLAQYAGFGRALRRGPDCLPPRRLQADLHARLVRRPDGFARLAGLAVAAVAVAASVLLLVGTLRSPTMSQQPAGEIGRAGCPNGVTMADCPTAVARPADQPMAVESSRRHPLASVESVPREDESARRSSEADRRDTTGQAAAGVATAAPERASNVGARASAEAVQPSPPVQATVTPGPVSSQQVAAPTAPAAPPAEPRTPTATPALMLAAVQTALPLFVSTTPTPTVPSCAIQTGADFGGLLTADRSLAQALGCAVEPPRLTAIAVAPFERGRLIWLGETRQILVLVAGGNWTGLVDTWHDGDPEPTVVAPTGLVAPVRGFGKVWRQQPGLREAIGWALGPERSGRGTVQQFTRGLLVRIEDRIVSLRANGTWQEFMLTPPPTPTPTPTPTATAPPTATPRS